jgi:hypothetical protein
MKLYTKNIPTYQSLKEEYINKYNILNSISWDATEEFEDFKDELQNNSEFEFSRFYNLSNIKLWIQEITEAIDMESTNQQLGDYVEDGKLSANELCTIG